MTVNTLKITFLCLILSVINQKAIAQKGVKPQNDSLIIIEKPAEFPNGTKAMLEFIKNNLRFSKQGNADIMCTVYVGFCVETDGTLTDIKVRRGFRKDYDAEAIRLIAIMPKWTPAVEFGTGKNVKNYFTVPIKFKLE